MSPSTANARDFRGLFFLHAFVHLSLADRNVERREQVWIKRHLTDHGLAHLLPRLDELIAAGGCDPAELERLTARAAAELGNTEKRRFVYNLAQLMQSKGAIQPQEYERILDMAVRLGVADTDADAILHSVYNVNDTFIAVLGLAAIGAILYFTQVVIVPLVIAVFISMIIHRVEALIARALRLQRFRWLNKVAAMVVILGVLFGLVMAAVVSARDMANRYPEYQARIEGALQESQLAQAALAWLQEAGVSEQLGRLPIGSTISGFLGSLVNLLGNFLLVMVFTGFLVFGSSAYSGVLQEMHEKISAYISVKTLLSFITGALAYLLCRLFGVDFALFWAILAFLLNYIPSVGSFIATVPPIVLAVVQLPSLGAALVFGALFVLIQVLLGQVVEPKLMGTRLALKPVAILLGLIFWGFLWGIPGMFLATPLMALLRILSSYFNFSRGIARLLSAEGA